jgi:hypothetical protein
LLEKAADAAKDPSDSDLDFDTISALHNMATPYILFAAAEALNRIADQLEKWSGGEYDSMLDVRVWGP